MVSPLVLMVVTACTSQILPTTSQRSPGREEIRVADVPVASAQTSAASSSSRAGEGRVGSRGGSLDSAGTAIMDLGDVFFGFDRATLEEDALMVVEANAKLLRRQRGRTIRIEGYCDERGTAAYNLVLGEQRAQAVRDALANLRVSSHDVTVVSYGKKSVLRQTSRGLLENESPSSFCGRVSPHGRRS